MLIYQLTLTRCFCVLIIIWLLTFKTCISLTLHPLREFVLYQHLMLKWISRHNFLQSVHRIQLKWNNSMEELSIRQTATWFCSLKVDLALRIINSRQQQITRSVDGDRQVSVMADSHHPLDLQNQYRVKNHTECPHTAGTSSSSSVSVKYPVWCYHCELFSTDGTDAGVHANLTFVGKQTTCQVASLSLTQSFLLTMKFK